MTDDLQRLALARSIAARLQPASLDEIRILDRILVRLELGRERYGLLDLAKPRDWRKERFEERLDVLVYDVAYELAAEDAERAGLRDAARIEMLGADQDLERWREHDATRVSPEPARIAFDDLREHEPYDGFDVSDVDGGEGG